MICGGGENRTLVKGMFVHTLEHIYIPSYQFAPIYIKKSVGVIELKCSYEYC